MSDLGTKCAGHEGAGVIVKVGDGVKTLKPGMRAGFKVSSSFFLSRDCSIIQTTTGIKADIVSAYPKHMRRMRTLSRRI